MVDTTGCCRLIEVFQLRDVYGLAPDIPGPAATLWSASRVARTSVRRPGAANLKRVLAQYERQTDDEALEEDEAAYELTTHAAMGVPVDL